MRMREASWCSEDRETHRDWRPFIPLIIGNMSRYRSPHQHRDLRDRSRISLPASRKALPASPPGVARAASVDGSLIPGCAVTAFSAPHPVGDPAKILGDDVPVASGLEIIFLKRAIFGRSRHERGLQSQLLRGLQVVIMSGYHHHLLWRQAEQLRGAEIGLRVGL